MHLTSFRISNGALAAESLPGRLKILNWGDNPNVKGVPIRVTERTVSALNCIQPTTGFGAVALDYEHNTVPGTPEFKRTCEPRKVAGYGRPEVVPFDGVYFNIENYTPSGMENAREYIDLSPTVKLDPKTNEMIFLHSVALCRQGAVDDLHFYNTNQEEMTVEEMQKQIDELSKQVAALTTKIDALTTPKEDASVALSANVKDLETKLLTLSTDWAATEAKREKAAIEDLAKRDGKVIALTADAIAKLSVSDLSAYVASLKPTVPLSRQTPPDAASGDGHGSYLERYNAIKDPTQKAVFYRENRVHIVG